VRVVSARDQVLSVSVNQSLLPLLQFLAVLLGARGPHRWPLQQSVIGGKGPADFRKRSRTVHRIVQSQVFGAEKTNRLEAGAD